MCSFSCCAFAVFKKRTWLLVTFITLLYLLFLQWTHHGDSQLQSRSERNGYISERLDIDGNQFRTVLQTSTGRIQVTYKINQLSEKKQLQKLEYGNYLFLKGEITPPQKSRNFDQFDYAAFLEKNNIKAVFQAKELRIGTKKRNTPLLLIKNYRRFLYTHIENTLPQPTSAYTAALVLGERTNFSEESYRDFQELGVVHLLAISGLHIQVLLKAVYYLLIRIRLPHEYAKISIVIFIPFYIFLTGAGPSVTRAGIMALLSYLLPLFMKKIDPFTALCASGIICLFIRPMQLFDVGFQLSYALTAGIILSNQKILRRFTSNWSQMFVLSWITTWISIPIVCYHFYQISWTGIFLNLIYVPLFVFFVLPLSFLSFCFPIAAVYGNPLLLFMEKITHYLGSIPYQVLITGRPHPSLIIAILALIYLFFLLWENRKTSRYICLIAVFVLLLLSKSNWIGKVTFIDIGQGDSILIQLPNNKGNYLIDTGGQMAFQQEKWQKRRRDFTVGKNILVPVLKSKGIGKLDKVIVTHSDADHMGALEELEAEITMKQLYHGEGAEQKKILQKALQKWPSSKVHTMRAGDSWDIGDGIHFECLYPSKQGKGENNDSLVIKANLDGKTWLFTGDLEAEGEVQLLNKAIRADILKVGHHGSKTSTSLAFAKTVNPRIAIISCGVNNRFGHPHRQTLATLQQIGAVVFRTDLQGEIRYTFGQGFTFKLD